jgi:hypothetical protein
MNSIFISYRRDDTEGQAGRLYDDLVAEFGPDSVFMDVIAIQPGRDFRKAIDQSLSSCGVFLSVIGKGWLSAKDTSGNRRLEDPADFVRVETATALKRDIPLIPVLVQGASTPKADQLPEDLKDLAYRNAIELTHARWDSDVQLLIKALRVYVATAPPRAEASNRQHGGTSEPGRAGNARNTRFVAIIGAALLAVAGLVFYLFQPRKAAVPDLPAKTPEQARTASNAEQANPGLAESRTKEAPPTDQLAKSMAKEKPRVEETRTQKVPVESSYDVVAQQLQLAAEARPLPQKDAAGNARYSFTLSVNVPERSVGSISRVHYDLVYASNPLSLDGGPSPGFPASYEGWGCYRKVVVTAYLSAPVTPSQVQKTFDMCTVLHW